MTVIVRRARPEDLADVGRITVEAYRHDGHLATDADYMTELADAATRDREAELWVATDEGVVVGSVTYCLPGTAFAELARDDEGEFRMLGVAAPSRGRGVAEALVRTCIQRSRELGHRAVVLCSMKEMATAHRLYVRLGFERLPARDWSPVDGVDLQAFILPLD